MAKTEKLRLGELLLRQDVITDDQLALALALGFPTGFVLLFAVAVAAFA